MKPTFREYLSILIALLAILACGIGVGYLIGERQGRREALARMPAPGQDPAKGSWQDRTLARLTKQLGLSDTQKALVAGEIQRTSAEIHTSRDHALKEYYLHLLTLHDRILPHLNPDQRTEIEADKTSLQQTIKLRFASHISPE